MVHLITGNKGKGKTKWILDKANSEVKDILGNICYLDKSTQHMYELNNRIRLINVADYMIDNSDQFLGFVSGIISQDHDLEQMYLDSFLTISCVDNAMIEQAVNDLSRIGEKYGVTFILSVSEDKPHLPANAQERVIIDL